MTPETEHFLSGIHCPINRSDLIVCLAAGQVMQVDRLPVDLLPTVVLLAVIGVRRYNQQIVDDYTALLRRMVAVIDEKEFSPVRMTDDGERYDHPNFNIVNGLVNMFMEDERGAQWLDDMPETWYMTRAYEELMALDAEELFNVKTNRPNTSTKTRKLQRTAARRGDHKIVRRSHRAGN